MTVFGWDMSHFDSPDIGTAVSQGIEFITHKAGGDAPDAELATWWNNVKNTKPEQTLLGAYWVLYPGNPAGRAASFIARLDSQCPGWRDRPFLLQVDCEKWNGDAGTIPPKTDIKEFCDSLVTAMPKLRPIVYAPNWVYGNKLVGLGYPLWASSYVPGVGGFKTLYPGDTSGRWSAYSGQTPAILQYTSSAIIDGQSTCDANAYRGTFNQLVALVAPGWSPSVDEKSITNTVWNQDGILTNPHQRSNAKTDPTQRAAFGLEDVWQQVYNLRDQITTLGNTLSTAIAALPTAPVVDVDEAAIVAGILAGLPADLAKQIAEAELDAAARRLAS